MTIFGVDVSSHQGTAVDWAKVAAAGFKFAINRACLDTKPDATWPDNTRRARAAGLIPGAYHFLYPSGGGGSAARPAAEQCDAFLAAIGNPDGLLIALDVESDKTPDGFVYKPTFADVKAWVARFREKHPTHPLLIYSGGWYWTGWSYPIHNAVGAPLGLLWDSHYVSAGATTAGKLYAGVPASWWGPRYGGWTKVTLLQFSSSGLVPGVVGHCDVNAFQGTVEQLRALAASKPASAPPPPSPEADMRPLASSLPGYTITVKPTANVRADATLGATILRVVVSPEVWTIIGPVIGDVDPDGGSNVWYLRWGAGHYEFTAKSNVTAGPTAPASDCTAAVNAAKVPLQATIDSQAATIAGLKNDAANAASAERERLAGKAGEAEAARVRAL